MNWVELAERWGARISAEIATGRSLFKLDRRLTLRAAAAFVIGYSVLVLVYANSVPYVGVEIFGRVVRDCHELPVVGRVPKRGDRLFSIAGQPIDSLPRFLNVLAHLRDSTRFPRHEISGSETLATSQSGVASLGRRVFVRMEFIAGDAQQERYWSWFEVLDQPWKQSIVSIIWFAAESLVFWAGWLAFRRNPRDDASALFFLMCIVTVGAYMGGYHWLRIASSPGLLFVFAICAMAVPQVSLHFFLSFPRQKGLIQRRPASALVFLYGIPAVLQIAILIYIGLVVSTFRHQQSPEIVTAKLTTLWKLVTAYFGGAGLMFGLSVASLTHAMATTRQPVLRNQVRWILFGAGLSTVFVAYALFQAFSDPLGFALGNATWAMFFASLVFTWAYAVGILKYRLLDVQEILQRGMLYLALSVLAGAMYYGLLLLTLWATPHLFADASRGQAFFAPMAVLGVLLVLGAIRTRFQKIVDRRFFREKSRLEKTMRRMDEAVGQLVDSKAAAERALAVILESLAAGGGAIYARDQTGLSLRTLAGAIDPPAHFGVDHPLWAQTEGRELIQLTPERRFLGDPLAVELARHGIELVQGIRNDNKTAGVLMLTARMEGFYESADLESLQALSEMLGMLLSATSSQETLEKLNEELRDKVARLSRQTTQLLALQNRSETPVKPESADDAASTVSAMPLVGSGIAMREIERMVSRIASSPSTVLIRGESGTGKSLLAEIVHRNSGRRDGPFVKVQCASLSPGLLESELFGHVKGAFTGAHRDKAGRFQMADGGTLFLDEIGDISLDLQTKLLRVVQEMTFEPVGSNDPVKVDVRIIAATHQPLEELIRLRRFREDLFYRLNVISLWMPPLRDRQEDIIDLAVHFMGRFAAECRKPVDSIDDEAAKVLLEYPWPGNVRELENVIERAVVLASGRSIVVEDLPVEIRSADAAGAFRRANSIQSKGDRSPSPAAYAESVPFEPGGFEAELEEVERNRLIDALRLAGGNKSKAASILGLPRSTFCSKLKKHGIEKPRRMQTGLA